MSEVDAGTDFAPLERLLADMTAGIGPGERKRWAGDIATDLRNSNAKRERANVQPDGEAMTPRKRKKEGKRGVKAGRMFQRASTTRFLKKRVTVDGAAVGFTGSTARIMRVHQYGLQDAVSHQPGAKQALYPKREILGISADDRVRILERISLRLND